MLDHIKDIIIKKLFGSAGEEELVQLKNWLAESEYNLKEYAKMETLFKTSEELNSYQHFDKGKAWSTIVKKNKKSQRNRITYLVLLLILLISTAYFSYRYAFTMHSMPTYPQLYAAKDAKLDITLEDESLISLAPDSKIEVTEFRKVKLSGKAFFQIEKNSQHPFWVEMGDQKVEVLGTSFMLDYQPDQTELIVTSGEVRFYCGDRQVNVAGGNTLNYYDSNVMVSKSNEPNKLSWHNDLLIFSNTPLQKAIADIEKHYHTKFVMNEEIKKSSIGCYLTSKYQGMKLQEILKELEELFSMKYNEEDKNIVITGIKCP